MTPSPSSGMTIGIVGAGFGGVSLVAALAAATTLSVHVVLIEKTGEFGAGDAYGTPYPFHLLNARAMDMSVYEHDPEHFVQWLSHSDLAAPYLAKDQPLALQYLPRFIYRHYLQSVLAHLEQQSPSPLTITRMTADIIRSESVGHQTELMARGGERVLVDKVVFCLGNPPVPPFPFAVPQDMQVIESPWEYTRMAAIHKEANVAIVGSGLSMIDAVLSLHHAGHQGKITAVSRHGLLPLPHSAENVTLDWQPKATTLRALVKAVREKAAAVVREGGDWRSLMSTLRHAMPTWWASASVSTREQWLRHVLPYWNIHRHRVHDALHHLLETLAKQGQWQLLSGRVIKLENKSLWVQARGTHERQCIQAEWVVNCMGSGLRWKKGVFSVLDHLLETGCATLDSQSLGLAITPDHALIQKNGEASDTYYALGPLVKGMTWESIAAPEIRKQCVVLTKMLTQSFAIRNAS